MTARHLGMDKLVAQLSSLKDNSASFVDDDPDRQIWKDDVVALEAAISICSALQDEGVNDAEGLRDLLFDYRAQARQIREMRTRYEVEARPVNKGGLLLCPRCNRRVAPRHSYCHWCGKRLEGR